MSSVECRVSSRRRGAEVVVDTVAVASDSGHTAMNVRQPKSKFKVQSSKFKVKSTSTSKSKSKSKSQKVRKFISKVGPEEAVVYVRGDSCTKTQYPLICRFPRKRQSERESPRQSESRATNPPVSQSPTHSHSQSPPHSQSVTHSQTVTAFASLRSGLVVRSVSE